MFVNAADVLLVCGEICGLESHSALGKPLTFQLCVEQSHKREVKQPLKNVIMLLIH